MAKAETRPGAVEAKLCDPFPERYLLPVRRHKETDDLGFPLPPYKKKRYIPRPDGTTEDPYLEVRGTENDPALWHELVGKPPEK